MTHLPTAVCISLIAIGTSCASPKTWRNYSPGDSIVFPNGQNVTLGKKYYFDSAEKWGLTASIGDDVFEFCQLGGPSGVCVISLGKIKAYKITQISM
jgi:hypothetical protein